MAVLSSLIVLSGCRGDSSADILSGNTLDFNLAVIDDVSDASPEGLRIISMTFSDKSGNVLKMQAGSCFKALEAGYYEVGEAVSGRLEATVELICDGRTLQADGGSMYVRKKNHEYDISWTLSTPEGMIRCNAADKNIYFESETYGSLPGGTGSELKDLVFKSSILNSVMKYSVYLPAGYDAARKYPVLYLLHGMDGDNNDWLTNASLNACASACAEEFGKDLVIVCPEGRNLFYCDGYEHGMNYMSYFFEEFVPFIEKEYSIRTERGSRAVAGLSMGGYGSLYYGLLHPDMFCHVYACSPAVNVGGSVPDLVQMLSAASSAGRVEALPGITVEIGTEDFLFSGNEDFVRSMDSYNVAYEYITRSGAHTWPFWNACCPKIIRKVCAAFE